MPRAVKAGFWMRAFDGVTVEARTTTADPHPAKYEAAMSFSPWPASLAR